MCLVFPSMNVSVLVPQSSADITDGSEVSSIPLGTSYLSASNGHYYLQVLT